MFGSLGAPELIIIGLVVVLLFGVGKIGRLGKDLGVGVKEFRRAMAEEDEAKALAVTVEPVTSYPPQPPLLAAPGEFNPPLVSGPAPAGSASAPPIGLLF